MFLLENTWKFHSFQFEPSKSFTACSPSPTCTWRLFCRHCRDGYRRCPRGLRSPQPRWRPPPPAAEKGSPHRKPCSNSHQLLGHLRHINTQTCSFHLPLSQQSSEALSQEENETNTSPSLFLALSLSISSWLSVSDVPHTHTGTNTHTPSSRHQWQTI